MKIVIVGAGEVGSHLAKLLSREEQDIILVDDDQGRLSAIDANYNPHDSARQPYIVQRSEKRRRGIMRPLHSRNSR